RKRSEQLVRRSEARFRQLFEVAADATFLIDRRGTILEVNPAGAALAGVKDPAALRGINIGELLPPRELESARQYLRDLLHDRPRRPPRTRSTRPSRTPPPSPRTSPARRKIRPSSRNS